MRVPLESIINKTFNNILVLGEGTRIGKNNSLGLKVKCLLCSKEYNMLKESLGKKISCGCHTKNFNNCEKLQAYHKKRNEEALNKIIRRNLLWI